MPIQQQLRKDRRNSAASNQSGVKVVLAAAAATDTLRDSSTMSFSLENECSQMHSTNGAPADPIDTLKTHHTLKVKEKVPLGTQSSSHTRDTVGRYLHS